MSHHRSTVTDTDWSIKHIELLGESFIVGFENQIRMVIPIENISNSLMVEVRKELHFYAALPQKQVPGPEGGIELSRNLGSAILRYVTTGRVL